MAVRQINVGAIEVSGVDGLDPIDVFWKDIEPGRGSVTIACYGEAWTAYFNAMSGKTIGEFFISTDTSYMVNKLTTPRSPKRVEKYLTQIVDAIKYSIR